MIKNKYKINYRINICSFELCFKPFPIKSEDGFEWMENNLKMIVRKFNSFLNTERERYNSLTTMKVLI